MTANVAKDLPFRGPTCPRCHELNAMNAVVCAECGSRLVPDRRTLERWMRVRGAVCHVAEGVDRDEIANAVVADVERRHSLPWPNRDKAA